jgi:hypothetical protein
MCARKIVYVWVGARCKHAARHKITDARGKMPILRISPLNPVVYEKLLLSFNSTVHCFQKLEPKWVLTSTRHRLICYMLESAEHLALRLTHLKSR